MEKLVGVTFAGRKRYMEILFPYLEKYKKYMTQYRIYVATTVPEDIQYIEAFHQKHPEWITLIYHPKDLPFDKVRLWCQSYKDCIEEDTIYLKIDDDIVYLEESLFTDFIAFRKEHPEYLITFPLVINNTIISAILQKNGLLPHPTLTSHILDRWPSVIRRMYPRVQQGIGKKLSLPDLIVQDDVLCPITWGNIDFCKYAHTTFLKDVEEQQLQKYRKEPFVLQLYEPVSVHVCAWFGKSLKELQETYGSVYEDELWLTVFSPIWSQRYNAVYPKTIVSHFSYWKQEQQGLATFGILEKYKHIQEKACLT